MQECFDERSMQLSSCEYHASEIHPGRSHLLAHCTPKKAAGRGALRDQSNFLVAHHSRHEHPLRHEELLEEREPGARLPGAGDGFLPRKPAVLTLSLCVHDPCTSMERKRPQTII